jgi:hypothetical protein
MCFNNGTVYILCIFVKYYLFLKLELLVKLVKQYDQG